MAGQAPSRRQLLQALAYGSLASGFTGFSRWAFAFAEPQHVHHMPSAPPTHTAAYKPKFFTSAQFATVVQIAEIILPHTGSTASHLPVLPADAGATDAGVAEFVDFMASHDPALQPIFLAGLAWLDGASPSKLFSDLSTAAQNTLLSRIAYKKNFQTGDESGQIFFPAMRKYTVIGFYTSRIGLESLDYPGLRFYPESPSIPNDGSLQRLGVS